MPDPIVALTFAAARTSKLKLGTSVQVLPGRNPVLLAKQWASLDVLSNGRALPAFGLGVVDPKEQQAFGVTREERAPWFDEALPLMRRLWSEEPSTTTGLGSTTRARPSACGPRTRSTSGSADACRPSCAGSDGSPTAGSPASARLRRWPATARSSTTPRRTLGGRSTPSTSGPWSSTRATEVPEAYARTMAERRGVDASEVVVTGLDALRDRLQEFVDVGFSKLVAVPVHEVASWPDELDTLADAVLDLQT